MVYKDNFKKKLILNSEVSNINQPKLLNKKDKKLFEKELIRKINKVYIFKFKQIFLYQNFTPITFKKVIFTDFLKFNSLSKFILLKKFLLLLRLFKFFFKNKKTIKKKNLIIVHDRHSENYFHWITDVLPKILWLKEKNFLNKYKILIPNFKNRFQKYTSLDITDKIQMVGKDNHLLINNGYYIPEFYPSGLPRLKNLLKLRNFFLKKYKCQFGNQKIYISRKISGRRRLKNENKLIQLLKKRNFKILFMENLNFKDQVIESAKSKLIVSVHGAGLTNLIWMKKKSKIIELRDQEDVTLNPYFVLCQKIGIYYNYFLTNKSLINKINPHNNYVLNIKEFAKKHEKLLSS